MIRAYCLLMFVLMGVAAVAAISSGAWLSALACVGVLCVVRCLWEIA